MPYALRLVPCANGTDLFEILFRHGFRLCETQDYAVFCMLEKPAHSVFSSTATHLRRIKILSESQLLRDLIGLDRKCRDAARDAFR